MPIKFIRNGNLVSQCILRLKRIWIARISWDLLAPLNISNSGDVLSEWGLVDERGRGAPQFHIEVVFGVWKGEKAKECHALVGGIFADLSIPVWQDASLFRWWILDAKLQIAWGTDWQTYIEYLTKTNWQSKDKDRYDRLAKLANLYWVTDKKFCARKYYRKTMTSN